jgi:hypothetical protein
MTTDSSRAGWRKSSHSGANGSCIEVACLGSGAVAVRDSKNPGGPRLTFTASQWKSFTESLKPARSVRPQLLCSGAAALGHHQRPHAPSAGRPAWLPR